MPVSHPTWIMISNVVPVTSIAMNTVTTIVMIITIVTRCAVKSVVMKKTVAHQSPAVCALSLVRTDCLLMSAT